MMDVLPEFAVGRVGPSALFLFVRRCIVQFDPENLRGSADDFFWTSSFMAVNHRLINDSNGSVLLSSWRTLNMLAHLKLCHPNTVGPTKYVFIAYFKEKFYCVFPQHTYIYA
jgi:hypothetical protein